jgi:hypothetical protein
MFLISIFLIHLFLLSLFSLKYYLVYFFFIIIFSYLLSKYHSLINKKLIFITSILLIFITNTAIYNELYLETIVYFDIFTYLIYINSEVMYGLSILHLIVLLNLKKIDTFEI